MIQLNGFWTTLDVYLASFLLLCGIRPDLEVRHGKVIFKFKITDDLFTYIALFNENTEVKVTDYVTCVKTLRSRMLTMRGNHGEGLMQGKT